MPILELRILASMKSASLLFSCRRESFLNCHFLLLFLSFLKLWHMKLTGILNILLFLKWPSPLFCDVGTHPRLHNHHGQSKDTCPTLFQSTVWVKPVPFLVVGPLFSECSNILFFFKVFR